MVTSFKRAHAHTATVIAPDPEAGHFQPTTPQETPGVSWACLGQSFLGSLLLSPGSWCAQGSVCALQESVSPVLCQFRSFYGGVNGDFRQEGLSHIQVCCTRSPCPCGRPLPTRTSSEETQTQFWLSLCGLAICFVPFPGLSSSGDQVLGKRTVPGGPCVLIISLVPATSLPYTLKMVEEKVTWSLRAVRACSDRRQKDCLGIVQHSFPQNLPEEESPLGPLELCSYL